MDTAQEATAGEVVVLELEGALDGRSAPAVRHRVAQLLARGDRLLLDVSALTYVSGASLRTLLLAYRRTAAAGSRLALAGVPAEQAEIMRSTGSRHFFDCFETVADGLSALAA